MRNDEGQLILSDGIITLKLLSQHKYLRALSSMQAQVGVVFPGFVS